MKHIKLFEEFVNENTQPSIIGPKTKKINKMVDHATGKYNWYALEDGKTPLSKEYLKTLKKSGIKYEDTIIAKDGSITGEDIRNILNLFKIDYFEVNGESAVIFDGTK